MGTDIEKPGDNNRLGQARTWSDAGGDDGAARVSGVHGREREAWRIRKEPRQRRSRRMVGDILQATAEVFAELGYARTTTNKIADRAGVSVGSLYQYFSDKDALLAVLWSRHEAQVHAAVRTGLARLADPTTDLEDGLRRFLEELVAVHRADPALTAALSTAVLRESPVGEKPHDHEEELGRARQLVPLLAQRPDVRDGDHLSMALVLAQTMGHLTRWLSHDTPASVDQASLVEETVQLMTRYLRG